MVKTYFNNKNDWAILEARDNVYILSDSITNMEANINDWGLAKNMHKNLIKMLEDEATYNKLAIRDTGLCVHLNKPKSAMYTTEELQKVYPHMGKMGNVWQVDIVAGTFLLMSCPISTCKACHIINGHNNATGHWTYICKSCATMWQHKDC